MISVRGSRWAVLGSVACLGCSAQVQDAGSACNDVSSPTNHVEMRVVVGTREAAVGGKVADGVYETVDRAVYVSAPGGASYPSISDRYVVKGDRIDAVAREPADAAEDRRSFHMTFAGTTLTYDALCPADGAQIEFGYTATPTEIRFYKPADGPTGFVTVLRRVGP